MVEATPVASQGAAWLAHHMQNLPVYLSLLGAMFAGIKFYREYKRERDQERQERQQERQDVAVWRARLEERVKCLEKTGG